jgi:4'-phosphopantetheinyl transferase
MTPLPAARSVDVWRILLTHPELAHDAAGILSDDERDRAARFRFERDRSRFVAAHIALRRVLATALDADPASIVFGSGMHGKPFVAVPSSSLEFNLSHSGDYALLALATGRPVGVDIERIADLEHDSVARQFFSAAEAAKLHGVDGGRKAAAFAACWTRKEAYLKASGAGVTAGLDHFDVALLPDEPVQLLADRRDPDAGRWKLVNLDAPDGYAAALVAEGHDWQVDYFTLT